MKKVKFQINKIFGGHKPGDVVEIECDDDGLPIPRYWYRRFLDSPIDNCISVIEESMKSKKEDK